MRRLTYRGERERERQEGLARAARPSAVYEDHDRGPADWSPARARVVYDITSPTAMGEFGLDVPWWKL
jgi:hypothetical protein